ncbi:MULTISPECIES: hypothetical protein [unclassified Paludibacterium]|uniref:hypothetical protein n=1 Tax=unclassified Paludibacterium TaxID=2618429 RepID=UPI001C04F440|nr:hypothetical protein [Paludibacterium sp. B53371]BEV71220.1 hypothetical protein THUN1379_07020 [Paludibacterium sp. THUN1379]
MKRLITAALLIVLGAAQAMPVPKPGGAQNASAQVQNRASGNSTYIMDLDDDEAAPPVHIHRAESSGKKSSKKQVQRKTDASGNKTVVPIRRVKRFPTPASQ